MKFPRNQDNTLNFEEFDKLPLAMRKEAFTELETNGTLEEVNAFQARRILMQQQRKAEADQSKARMAELQEQMKALRILYFLSGALLALVKS